jgi:replication factor C small subunit
MANRAHESPDNDFLVVNVADFFDRTKKEIRSDPRFESFLTGRSSMAKREMINRVLKESASYAPMSGEYKTLLLDNAEAIREDFQQALRRVMERYHRNTRFVIATRQPTKLIPPIRSRCFPVPMRAPTTAEVVAVLERIADREGVDYDDDGLEYVAGYADGDLRKAVLAAQTVAGRGEAITMSEAHEVLGEVGPDDRVEDLLVAAEEDRLGDARSTVNDLLYDEGYEGEELLAAVLEVARRRYADDRLLALYERAGPVDLAMAEGTTDRVHLLDLVGVLAE